MQKLAALVLAAGKGSRLGGGKMTLPWQGKSLAAHVLSLVEQSASFTYFVCVTGNESKSVCKSLHQAGIQGSWSKEYPLPPAPQHVPSPPAPYWHEVYNPFWADGQSTSLLAGIHHLKALASIKGLESVMVFLGDQPLIKPATIRTLLASHHHLKNTTEPSQHPLATAPCYQGQRGNPVLLDSLVLPYLENITGDSGARGLLQRMGSLLNTVEVTDPGVLFDIDTHDDYSALLQGSAIK